MELWIKPKCDANLRDLYEAQIIKHNASIDEPDSYPDSGFDLFIPFNKDHPEGKWIFPPNTTIRIPLGIKMVSKSNDHFTPCARRSLLSKSNDRTYPYYIYARSSISKTPLRLANNQGIIDAGYRGELMVALDNIIPKTWVLWPGSRLLQTCKPDLSPFKVWIVAEDFEETKRGAGGFGSTGR